MGAIVCKLDFHKKVVKRGYIAMLAVDSGHRKRKIGSTLVKRAIDAMIAEEADEVSYKVRGKNETCSKSAINEKFTIFVQFS